MSEEANIYESQRLLDEYLLFHYGNAEEILPWADGPVTALNFPQRTVRDLIDSSSLPTQARALDLGCAVGRSSFELRNDCAEVIGVDYSQRFIDAARHLQQSAEPLAYAIHEEGHLFRQAQAHRPVGCATSGLHFEQGDAMDLRVDLGSFDVVHAANLLCRLPQPMRCLARLPDLVRPGGQLLLTTPCTWLASFTPPANWPQHQSTLEWLQQHLQDHFELEERRDMPFLIREHARKFQWSMALGMRWRRRA